MTSEQPTGNDEQAPSPTDLMNGAEQPPYQAGTPVRHDETPWPDWALTRDEMVRLVGIGIAMTKGHAFARVGPKAGEMEPGPNTMRLAATCLDSYAQAAALSARPGPPDDEGYLENWVSPGARTGTGEDD